MIRVKNSWENEFLVTTDFGIQSPDASCMELSVHRMRALIGTKLLIKLIYNLCFCFCVWYYWMNYYYLAGEIKTFILHLLSIELEKTHVSYMWMYWIEDGYFTTISYLIFMFIPFALSWYIRFAVRELFHVIDTNNLSKVLMEGEDDEQYM